MTLKTLPPEIGKGAGSLDELGGLVKELQGLNVSVVAGATAGTKMNIAAMRTEDTILAAVVSTDAGGALADDKANITIEDTRAKSTITISSTGPVANETVTINGKVFTFKTAPTDAAHVLIGANINATAESLKKALEAWENRRDGSSWNAPAYTVSRTDAVLTLTAVADGTAGNSIATVEAATNLTVSGATFAGGTATGGIKSTTNLASKSLIVFWFNKQ